MDTEWLSERNWLPAFYVYGTEDPFTVSLNSDFENVERDEEGEGYKTKINL